MISVTSLDSTLREVRKLLPGCSALLPDAIASAARDADIAVTFTPLSDWEQLDDGFILSKIIPENVKPDDELYIVTDASFIKASPFVVSLRDLDEFVSFHFSKCGECVVDGDVIVVAPRTHSIGVFHHEGYYSIISADG